jgi:hypothetical protein
MALVLLGALLAVLSGSKVHAGGAIRRLPDFFEDQVAFGVLVEISPSELTSVHSVEEHFPAGWTVSEVTHGGTIDSGSHTLRWGPFADNLSRTLGYKLTPPIDAPFVVTFQGRAAFNTGVVPTDGISSLPKRPGSAVRTLPTHYLPGQPLEVHLAVRPGASALAWALQEIIPDGWTPSPSLTEASFDPRTRTLKWGPFLDPAPRDLTYQLQPGAASRSIAVFSGTAIFESTPVPVGGMSNLPARPSLLTRQLPPPYTATALARIQILTDPAPYVALYSVEEDVPIGLAPDDITEGGVWDPIQRRIKWGPFADAQASTLSFRVEVSAHAPPSFSWSGRAIFDALEIPTGGPVAWSAADAPSPSSLAIALPSFFEPGQSFAVALDSAPSPTTEVHAIELSLPPGWSFVAANHDGTLDAVNRRVKWGPFHDALHRALEAELRPSRDLKIPAQLLAEGWFDAHQVLATGNSRVDPIPSLIRRTLPLRFTPGIPFVVRVDVQPAPTVELAFVEDVVPGEATVSQISEGGSFDAIQSKVKWGPFTGAQRRTLSYQVTPPSAPRRIASFSGVGVFDSLSVPIAGQEFVALNHAPLPQPDLIQRPPVRSAKFSVIELLANDSDVDGDSLRIRGVGGASASGASVRLIGPWIYYDAASGPPAEDQFSYTVEDAFGLRSVTSATVLFSSVPTTSRIAIVAVLPEPGGRARVRFRAVPGVVCRVEVSPDLRSWAFLAEGIAGPLGTGEVVDPATNATPIRFYRVSVR